jgi:SAM-dependent methyltransferase
MNRIRRAQSSYVGFRNLGKNFRNFSTHTHQATFLTRHYGVRVVGLELSATAVDWARKHSLGRFVGPIDAKDLSWVPPHSFDHFFSFASVYYVPPKDMCKFMKQVVRILRPGGTALFGWLGGWFGKDQGVFPRNLWADCARQINAINEISDAGSEVGIEELRKNLMGT